jgi:CDP-glycerol glycerophosphotransferase
VVVTAYDVQDHLLDCLRSVAAQTYQDLEVVVVVGGSTDSTAALAREFAGTDDRFRVLAGPEGGLSAARTAGIAATEGDLLAFVDGGGALLPRAYERLAGSMHESGSDLATGTVHDIGELADRPGVVADAFRTGRRATHIRDLPALLGDRLVANKLWRRSFWDQLEVGSPPDARDAEDTDLVVALRSHLLASTVDVVANPCYLHRGTGHPTVRDADGLRDRHRAVTEVSGLLHERGETALKRSHDELCAAHDFRPALQDLDGAGDAFQALFLDLTNDFFDRAHPEVFDPLPAIDRLKWHLVRLRRLPELLEVLRFERSGEIHQRRTVRRRRKIYGDYPFRGDKGLRIPDDVYRLDHELMLRSRVDEVRWEGDRLCLSGYAYIRQVELATADAGRIRLQLEHESDGTVLKLPVERVARPDITAAERAGLYDYDGSGFRTWVSVDDLRARDGGWRTGTWRLRVTLRCGGLQRSKRVAEAADGRAGRATSHQVDNVRIVTTTSAARFGVTVDSLDAVADSWRADGEVLEVVGEVTATGVVEEEAALLLRRTSDSTRIELPVALSRGSGPRWAFVGRVPLRAVVEQPDLDDPAGPARGSGVEWQASIRTSRAAKPRRLSAGDDLPEVGTVVLDREVLAGPDRRRLVALHVRTHRPVVTGLRVLPTGAFEITGRDLDPDPRPRELVLRAGDRNELVRFPVDRDGSGFRVSFDAGRVPTLAGLLPLAEGRWALAVAPVGSAGGPAPMVLSADAGAELPLEATAGAKTIRLTDVEESLLLVVGPDLLPDERGRFNQRRLREVEAPAFARAGLRDSVLFESYGGKQFADSPRAIFEELTRRDTRLELLWSVEDGQTALPPGVTPLRRGSRAWYEAQARSRYVVTCVYRSLQHPWDLAPDQVVLQTWHGAPLKKVGFDSSWIEQRATRDYHDRLRRETSGWTHLVSPSPAATPILRSAFRYSGDLLETGYPRTDVFYSPGRDALADRVRTRLGLPDGKKVILYAPTFRDDNAYRGNRFRMNLELDVEAAAARLGDDHVLLVRRHAKVVDSPVLGTTQSFAYDVSAYPDVNELLLVTDVLVTDYSSLMFDFANTGRPMIFFTYDLEAYSAIRAFYFDLAEILPGPRVASSAEVIQAVLDAAEHRDAVSERYRAFTEQFCTLDDGGASARVVDAVFR